MQILREALHCPDTEFVGIADVYTRRLEAAKQIAPNAKTYLDYRHLLDDKAVDAVLIASPQHLHCEHFVASLDAGKHVYQEKTMAFTVEHAKRMRAASEAPEEDRADRPPGLLERAGRGCRRTRDAREPRARSRRIHAHMYRNTPHGKPQWTRPIYPDMTPENIIWTAFLGEAPKVAFDANRYRQLALLLGLLRRQFLREYVPPGRVLVQGAGPPSSEGGDVHRRHLPLEGRPGSSGHDERRDGATRGDVVYVGLRVR